MNSEDPSSFRIVLVTHFHQWFHSRSTSPYGYSFGPSEIVLRHMVTRKDLKLPTHRDLVYLRDHEAVAIVRFYNALRVGDIGNRWADDTDTRIEFKYAKIQLAELFEFYTTDKGVLTLPTWSHFQYALDEFLEKEAPQWIPLPKIRTKDQDFLIKRVVNFAAWFELSSPSSSYQSDVTVTLRDIVLREDLLSKHPKIPLKKDPYAYQPTKIPDMQSLEPKVCLAIIRFFYVLRVGDIGSRWVDSNTRIEFNYAKILLADVFDFYTSADGVLTLPTWSHFQYVLDEVLAEDPRYKYHPSCVQAYVDAHGVEQLEMME